MKTFTQDEVVQLLLKERERCVGIVDAFTKRFTTELKAYSDDEADKDLKYIANREIEVCRKIANTIDGRLLASVNEPLINQITNEYFKNN
jgi:hypothetical protein